MAYCLRDISSKNMVTLLSSSHQIFTNMPGYAEPKCPNHVKDTLSCQVGTSPTPSNLFLVLFLAQSWQKACHICPNTQLRNKLAGPKAFPENHFCAFYCLDYNINYLCKQCNIAKGQDFEHQINCRLWKLRELFDHLPTNQVLEFWPS